MNPALAMQVTALLQSGTPLHMQFVEGRRSWWMETPLQRVEVPDDWAMAMLDVLVEAGDSLFGLPNNSQTYVKPK